MGEKCVFLRGVTRGVDYEDPITIAHELRAIECLNQSFADGYTVLGWNGEPVKPDSFTRLLCHKDLNPGFVLRSHHGCVKDFAAVDTTVLSHQVEQVASHECPLSTCAACRVVCLGVDADMVEVYKHEQYMADYNVFPITYTSTRTGLVTFSCELKHLQ
jgi:hypothetical protein